MPRSSTMNLSWDGRFRACFVIINEGEMRTEESDHESGILHINDQTAHDTSQMPFRGVKESGAFHIREDLWQVR